MTCVGFRHQGKIVLCNACGLRFVRMFLAEVFQGLGFGSTVLNCGFRGLGVSDGFGLRG